MERKADRRDFLRCAVGEVRDSPIFDLALLAVGLAQEDTAIGGAIGSGAVRLGDIPNYNSTVVFFPMLG